MTPGGRTDRAWEEYGKRDAYFGVLNEPRFRDASLDDSTRAEFFSSGQRHVDLVLADIHRHVAPAFAPRTVLDFGCGVGRLVIPFARVCEQVTGVDVSPSMLAEAARNCTREGVGTATFVISDDRLTQVAGTFDLVHSFIVLQHIPPERGIAIMERLLSRVTEGGVAALHVTYARNAPRIRKIVNRIRRASALMNGLVNLAQRRPYTYPLMAMYEYDPSQVLDSLRSAGITDFHLRLTDHGGHLGMMIYAQRWTGTAPG